MMVQSKARSCHENLTNFLHERMWFTCCFPMHCFISLFSSRYTRVKQNIYGIKLNKKKTTNKSPETKCYLINKIAIVFRYISKISRHGTEYMIFGTTYIVVCLKNFLHHDCVTVFKKTFSVYQCDF